MVRKKSPLARFFGSFVESDAETIKESIREQVIKPGIRKFITDVVDICINGSSTVHRGYGGFGSPMAYTNYWTNSQAPQMANTARSRGMQKDVIFSTRTDAEAVLEGLFGILEQYKTVRVADFNELAGVTGDWTDNNFGWDNLTGAKVDRTRDGYWRVLLPRCFPLN